MLIFFVTFGVVVLDQLTKFLVRLYMEVGQSVGFIPYIVNLTYVENDGAAFGMLDNARWLFIVVSTVAIAGIIVFLVKNSKRHPLLNVSLSFILGGGIGNMIDRIFVTNAEGAHVVTDFFDLQFMKFAVFNVADSFISVGAVMLGVYLVFFEPKVEKKLSEAAKQAAEAEDADSGDDTTNGNDSSDT